jgi:hypothetical protein
MITLIALGALALAAITGTIVVTARDGYRAQPYDETRAAGAAHPHATPVTRLG